MLHADDGRMPYERPEVASFSEEELAESIEAHGAISDFIP